MKGAGEAPGSNPVRVARGDGEANSNLGSTTCAPAQFLPAEGHFRRALRSRDNPVRVATHLEWQIALYIR